MGATGPSAAPTAGAIAGLAALSTFLIIHHAWIKPIWFIAPVGAVVAAGGGAVVGTAYAELAPRLPRRPWRAAAATAVFGLTLAPAVLIGEATGPIFSMDGGGGTLVVPESDAIAGVALSLVGSAVGTGLVLGGLIGRTRRAAAWTGLSALALAIGPGHNVPLLAASPAAVKGVAILVVVLVVAAVVLVEADAALARRSAQARVRGVA